MPPRKMEERKHPMDLQTKTSKKITAKGPTTPKTKAVSLARIDIRRFSVEIVGTAPLIMHRWSTKQKQQMLKKQMQETTTRTPKDPLECYESSKYVLPDKNGNLTIPCFPASAFKLCAVRGGKPLKMVMTDSLASFFVTGVYSPRDGREMVPIRGKFSMREDMVRLDDKTADIRFRAQIVDWAATLQIEYNAAAVSPEQIINALNSGGFGTGVGEWRVEKKGEAGRFRVVA
jgi:hypothetical protein